ncbi:S-adenosyl-l-methionine hydroxide adenosyltransferase family protein [Cryptosporangium sp. NPDC051539]|uniref:S-adenosyl-l-methionine hydroxide adenosyltransferase family protein n=1 Tax=Cryptosporangium sp. NPDC051539 TaxID=3363962 RepID=UPI00379F2ADF
MRHISFTTDYGLSDAFVAVCHGVALRAAPGVRIIDVTHLVPLADVRRGASVLADAVPYLPEGTVHVGVVDPGVGTARRAIAAETAGGLFVGPDNGLLLPAADALGGVTAAVELLDETTARTFHGRDLFMPAAARLATGARLAELGPAVDPGSLTRLAVFSTEAGEAWLETEVRSVDRFGSLQLAATATDLAPLGSPVFLTDADQQPIVVPRGDTFGDVPPGELILLIDSTGRAAISVNQGSAAERLGLGAGAVVRLES